MAVGAGNNFIWEGRVRYFIIFLTICTLIDTSPAIASLVSIDNPRFGPRAIVRDTVTNLEWLQVSKTYNKVANNEFGIGGYFEGFRFATWSEVMNLFGTHPQNSPGAGETVFQDVIYAKKVMDMVGPSTEMFGGAVDSPSLVGYYVSAYAINSPDYDHDTAVIIKVPNAYNHVFSTTAYATWGSWAAFSPSGSWLVRELGKLGDCDGSGKVSISEVQSAINMFLGLKQVSECVDLEVNGKVDISEVQKSINAFLGL